MNRFENESAKISAHVEKHLGTIDYVLHETLPGLRHIDVLVIKATEERPFHMLITSGMSAAPMNLPENADVSPYIELMLVLPPEWQLPQLYSVINHNQSASLYHWPIDLLKNIAEVPHAYDTWLGPWHTLPNGDPSTPFAENTELSGVIILPSLFVPQEFHQLVINKDKIIEFFSMVLIYKEEMDLVLEQGADALLDLFDQHRINDLLVLDRTNVAAQVA